MTSLVALAASGAPFVLPERASSEYRLSLSRKSTTIALGSLTRVASLNRTLVTKA
jgi:hypothetical protein